MQRTWDEHQELSLSGNGLTIISAIWRACCFGGRIEGYAPRSGIPLNQNLGFNFPYTIKDWAPYGEADVTHILNIQII
jgi:hypothetical protein